MITAVRAILIFVSCLAIVRCAPATPQTGAFAQTIDPTVPLPTNWEIRAPSPSVPNDLAAFSGMWAGAWGGVLSTTLVIEEVSSPGVVIVYAWGNNPGRGIRPGWVRLNATFDNGALVATLQNGAVVKFKMDASDGLAATYVRAGEVSRARLIRTPL